MDFNFLNNNNNNNNSNTNNTNPEIDNQEVLGLTLTHEHRKTYEVPGADDPEKLTSKCIQILLLPRILDVLCFFLAAGFFSWNSANDKYKYFAKRVLNPDSTTSFLSALFDIKTILATVVFALVTAAVFVLRVKYITGKRRKEKEPIDLPKQSFPHAEFNKAGVFFSTFGISLVLIAVYFGATLILSKAWDDMPVTVDLAICAGIIVVANIWGCFKVGSSVIRCYTCHVIAYMNWEFKVADTFYADATVIASVDQKYKHTKETEWNNHYKKEEAIHEYGTTHTYENVRHDVVRSSKCCPYCLQRYVEDLININDTLEGKKIKARGSYHNVQYK